MSKCVTRWCVPFSEINASVHHQTITLPAFNHWFCKSGSLFLEAGSIESQIAQTRLLPSHRRPTLFPSFKILSSWSFIVWSVHSGSKSALLVSSIAFHSSLSRSEGRQHMVSLWFPFETPEASRIRKSDPWKWLSGIGRSSRSLRPPARWRLDTWENVKLRPPPSGMVQKETCSGSQDLLFPELVLATMVHMDAQLFISRLAEILVLCAGLRCFGRGCSASESLGQSESCRKPSDVPSHTWLVHRETSTFFPGVNGIYDHHTATMERRNTPSCSLIANPPNGACQKKLVFGQLPPSMLVDGFLCCKQSTC